MTMQKHFVKKRLLVVIPCLNEAATIAQLISEIPRTFIGVEKVEVLVVDDGSTDTTAQEAASGAHVISHTKNMGVGRAFQTGVSYALEHDYDMMVNIDGDRQFDPKDISKLIAPVLAHQADMVTASRFVDEKLIPNMPKVKLVGNHMMSYLVSKLVEERFYDVSCGFRCYSREALLQLNLYGDFTYTQETFLDFAVKRLKIIEVPIKVSYFVDRKSRVAHSIVGYAAKTIKIIFRSFRDYFPLRFFWGVAFVFMTPAIILAFIFFGHYWLTGTFSGYLFAGLLSAFLGVVALVFFVIGILADMLDRIRANQERIIYILRSRVDHRRRKNEGMTDD